MQSPRLQGDRQLCADDRQGVRREARHQRMRTMAQVDEDLVADRLHHFHLGWKRVCIVAVRNRMQVFRTDAHGDVLAKPLRRHLGRTLWGVGKSTGLDGRELSRQFLTSGDQLLDEHFDDERLKTALAWMGAQSGPPTHEVATADLVGWNTVNVADASWTNTIGATELVAVWKDPDFDPSVRAFYYARVIEIPTPRWTAYDAVRFNIKMPPEVPMKHQERAWTSPVWYTPS